MTTPAPRPAPLWAISGYDPATARRLVIVEYHVEPTLDDVDRALALARNLGLKRVEVTKFSIPMAF